MLREPLEIKGDEVIVGMKIRVLYYESEGVTTIKEGRVTRITQDYLYRYVWVGNRVIAVFAKDHLKHPCLMEYEVFLLEDFMNEEQHALRRALLQNGIEIEGDELRSVLLDLEALGFCVRKFPKRASIVPKIKAEEIKREGD